MKKNLILPVLSLMAFALSGCAGFDIPTRSKSSPNSNNSEVNASESINESQGDASEHNQLVTQKVQVMIVVQ